MSTEKISKNRRPDKPYPEFPLTPSSNGQRCRKIIGKIYYFRHWDNWQSALDNQSPGVEIESTFVVGNSSYEEFEALQHTL